MLMNSRFSVLGVSRLVCTELRQRLGGLPCMCVVWLFCATLSTEPLLLCSLADFLYSITVVPCCWRSLRSNCPRWCFSYQPRKSLIEQVDLDAPVERDTWMDSLGTENKEVSCGAASRSVLDFVFFFVFAVFVRIRAEFEHDATR